MKKTIIVIALVLTLLVSTVARVQTFDLCLQDAADPTTYVRFSDQTAQYDYFCNGAEVASGTGIMIRFGSIGYLFHQKGSRVVSIQWDTSGNGSGTARIVSDGVSNCEINDNDMNDNTCAP